MPCSASGEIFLGKPLDKRSKVCYSYAPEEERAAGQTPDVLDIPTSVPRVRGAVTEVTWKLPLHDGAGDCPVKAGWSTLKTEHRQKFIWTRRDVNMEKNDIFNTNLLQLPMKAQVADEGVVQDITPVAAPADLAGGVAELELDALNQRGVALQRLSDVTPKNHEMLASGRLQCGEITLLCGDGGVGKGQFVAQIARSLTMGEATEVFPQAPERTGNVVILAGEDPIDAVLCPRMAAAGADLGKVVVIDSDAYYKKKGKMPYLGDPDLVNWIIAANPLVLVVDPLQAFFPNSANMNNRQQMRRVLQDLRMLAQQQGFAILLVTHTNKNPSAFGRKRLNGSGELWDTARSVLIMGHTRDGSKSYVSHEKSSYGVPTDTILFTTETVEVRGIKTVRLKFDSTSDWKDEDFCREKPDNKGQKYAEVQREILRTLNAAPGNCMVSKELQRLVVEKTGCSESTYNHARSALSGDGLIKNVRQIVPEVGVCGVTALTQSTAVA